MYSETIERINKRTGQTIEEILRVMGIVMGSQWDVASMQRALRVLTNRNPRPALQSPPRVERITATICMYPGSTRKLRFLGPRCCGAGSVQVPNNHSAYTVLGIITKSAFGFGFVCVSHVKRR